MKRQAQWPPLRHVASVSAALRIVAAVVLLLIAAAAYYEIFSNRDAVIADTERQMSRLDMVFAEQTGRAFEAMDLLIQGVAETVEQDVDDPSRMRDVLRRRLRNVRQLTQIAVFGPFGSLVISSDAATSRIPREMVAEMTFRYRSDPRASPMISEPFQESDGEWHALLERPITAPDGKLIGVVAGLINLSYFENFYRSVELNEDGSISLHLRDGTVLASFPHVDSLIGTSVGNLPPFKDVLAHESAGTILMESPADGGTRVTAIRALKSFPLAVMVSVKEGRVLVHWRRQTLALIAFALILGGAVIVLLLSLSRRSRQVERLLEETHAARNVAEEANDRLMQQISERERAEGALRQAQRIDAIGQLTGGVAHDFNNLLMVVLGNVEILQRKAAEERNVHLAQRLAAIRAAAERGATLTGHLLAFARRQPLMPRPTDLNETIRAMGSLLNSALGTRVQVRVRLAGGLWPAMVDQSQIELLILNLAINARDAMPGGGLITIETANHRRLGPIDPDGAPAGDYVSIIVEDTGCGIDPDILPRVFEPFFTTKPPGSGSGLGLSQVFGTAKQSGGEVQIRSEVGKGTTVIVDLPRAAAALTSTNRREEVPPGSGARILLVDDDDPVRLVTAGMLLDLGYDVLDAASGENALKLLHDNPPVDILITDLIMSGMNGIQVAAAARAHLPCLSVIYITGHGDQVGTTVPTTDRLIRKPFGAADLRRTIEAELANRRQALAGA